MTLLYVYIFEIQLTRICKTVFVVCLKNITVKNIVEPFGTWPMKSHKSDISDAAALTENPGSSPEIYVPKIRRSSS